MEKLQNDDDILGLIKNHSMAVIYFSGSTCNACTVIKSKIDNILNKYPKIKSGEINGEMYLDIAAKYNVFSLPIFLLYIDGKESMRLGRNLDLIDLEERIKRYYNMIY